MHARLKAKEAMMLAGIDVAARVFHLLDPAVTFTAHFADGDLLEPGAIIAEVDGEASSLLQGERVALNLLQRMCGVATQTAEYVGAVAGTRARVVDTRKTTPGLRMLEKYAVRVGGGINHRTGLYDGILIKENHIAAAGGITAAVSRARAYIPHTLKIEVETETLAEVAEALAAGTPVIATKGAPWHGLEREGCGWWIDHGVEPLVAALAKAMAMRRNALQEMGAKGRAWMARDFSWDRTAGDMLDVYRWVSSRGEAPSTVRLK